MMPLFRKLRRKDEVNHSVTRLRDLYSDLLTILNLEQDLEPTDVTSPKSFESTTTVIKTHLVSPFLPSYDGPSYEQVALEEDQQEEVVDFVPIEESSFKNDQSDLSGLVSITGTLSRSPPGSSPWNDFVWYQLSAYFIHPTVDNYENDISKELAAAREKEAQVVELIRSIGETVIYGEKNNRWSSSNASSTSGPNVLSTNHEVFEYFCDKNMISLLVDIMIAKPSSFSGGSSTTTSNYSGVAWTALVKAQILQTISIFVSNVSDQRSLYYLLSNYSIDKIIMSIVPLEQWSDSAMDEILPVYISFLKGMALQLSNKPDLFHFFCHQNKQASASTSGSTMSSSSNFPAFPLLYAAVEVATSTCKVAQSDHFVQTTALNIILNIFQLDDANISSVISESRLEQHMLMTHLCKQLNERYNAIVDIMIGKFVSPWRQEALICECRKLEEVLHLVTDFLWCSKSSVEVSKRLCEYILTSVIDSPILDNLVHLSTSLRDKSKSYDCECSEEQAKCLSSFLFLSVFFWTLDYIPLRRMVAVTIFHPYKPHKLWIYENKEKGSGFVFAPALNEIMKNNFKVVHDDDDDDDDSPYEDQEDREGIHMVKVESNSVRSIVQDVLSGNMGHRAFVLVALFVEKIILAEDFDLNMLQTFGLLPASSSETCWPVSSLSSYFTTLRSDSLIKFNEYALNMAISLSASMMIRCSKLFMGYNVSTEETSFNAIDSFNSLTQSILKTKHFLASKCKDSISLPLPEHLIPDMMERHIQGIYSLIDSKDARVEYYFDAQSFFSKDLKIVCSILIESALKKTDSEYDQNCFAFRALLLMDALDHISADFQNEKNTLSILSRIKASSDIAVLGSLNLQSIVGTDVVIKNQRFFRFSPSLALSDNTNSKSSMFTTGTGDKDKRRELADKILLLASSKSNDFLLVVDDNELLILKPNSMESLEGTILCCTLINNVIAIASDDEWLHIAIRNAGDVGVLISKGNMALRFRGVEECLRAKDYIQSVKSMWCAEMMEKIHDFCVRCEL